MSHETTHPPGHSGCCDADAIDELHCKAAGIKTRADVIDKSLQTLDPFKARFSTAKQDYGTARGTAAGDVKAAEEQLKAIREALRCRLDEEQRDCAERSEQKVCARIEQCVGEPGCREFPCDFTTEGHEDDPAAKLAGLIAHYQSEVDLASKFFQDDLLAEQTALPARAAKLKADATKLAADAADPSRNPLELYVRLLVLDRQVKGVWNGFPNVQEYVDCLCRTLLYVLKGWEAVATLSGWQAKRVCKDQGRQDKCKQLQDHTVDEVLAEAAKCLGDCAPHGGSPGPYYPKPC
ncbi:hypothetical protein ABZW30_19075 [Kitasatospora sp. NPDC004669]|uniref:hypothetical protein n=1 Tax=Kitasatospora sp. NPDC004669 TaxID=3154555 RepID=UPI0033BAB9B4